MPFRRGLRSILLVGVFASVPPLVAAQTPTQPPPQPPSQPDADALKGADAAFHAGYAALQAGNLEEARTQFAEAVRLAPQIPEGHEALGTALFE